MRVDETQPLSFELREASADYAIHDGTVTRSPRSFFLDWIIAGVPMREGIDNARDLVTPLNRSWLESAPKAVDVLTGRTPEADLEPGRVGILLCVVCGEIDVSAALNMRATTVVRSDLRWEGQDSVYPVEVVPPALTFERVAYELALEGAYERVASLPYDEPEHTVRRFLWPWQWGWKLPPRR
ncbi:hypothetical protein Kisp01_68960 [Kineosporia sp. NBRC 101677]|nr:hypothetical protein Kisp01_68960 [Kineosporia sp. NBRC 101677]